MLNKLNQKNKFGFSLAETMVALFIVTIIAAAAAPIVTRRTKVTNTIPHGRYECYKDSSGQLYERKSSKTAATIAPSVGSSVPVIACNFQPTNKAAYYIVQAIGGGAGGSDFRGAAGEVATMFIPTITVTPTITVGAAGTEGLSGGNSSFGVTDPDTSKENLLIGAGGIYPVITCKAKDLRAPYTVSYCSSSSWPANTCSYNNVSKVFSLYGCSWWPLSAVSPANMTYIPNTNPAEYRTNYNDILETNLPTSNLGEESTYDEYAITVGYPGTDMNFGNGGNASSAPGGKTNGQPGAVVIYW